LLCGYTLAADIDRGRISNGRLNFHVLQQRFEGRVFADGEPGSPLNGPCNCGHDGAPTLIGHEIDSVPVRKLKLREFGNGDVYVERRTVAYPADADMRSAVQRRSEIEKVRPGRRAHEFITGLLAKQTESGDTAPTFIHQNHVPILEPDGRHFSAQGEIIQIDRPDKGFSPHHLDVPITSPLGRDAARPVQIRHDGIHRPTRVSSGMVHKTGYIDGYRLGTLEIDVNIDVVGEDGGKA